MYTIHSLHLSPHSHQTSLSPHLPQLPSHLTPYYLPTLVLSLTPPSYPFPRITFPTLTFLSSHTLTSLSLISLPLSHTHTLFLSHVTPTPYLTLPSNSSLFLSLTSLSLLSLSPHLILLSLSLPLSLPTHLLNFPSPHSPLTHSPLYSYLTLTSISLHS